MKSKNEPKVAFPLLLTRFCKDFGWAGRTRTYGMPESKSEPTSAELQFIVLCEFAQYRVASRALRLAIPKIYGFLKPPANKSKRELDICFDIWNISKAGLLLQPYVSSPSKKSLYRQFKICFSATISLTRILRRFISYLE